MFLFRFQMLPVAIYLIPSKGTRVACWQAHGSSVFEHKLTCSSHEASLSHPSPSPEKKLTVQCFDYLLRQGKCCKWFTTSQMETCCISSSYRTSRRLQNWELMFGTFSHETLQTDYKLVLHWIFPLPFIPCYPFWPFKQGLGQKISSSNFMPKKYDCIYSPQDDNASCSLDLQYYCLACLVPIWGHKPVCSKARNYTSTLSWGCCIELEMHKLWTIKAEHSKNDSTLHIIC